MVEPVLLEAGESSQLSETLTQLTGVWSQDAAEARSLSQEAAQLGSKVAMYVRKGEPCCLEKQMVKSCKCYLLKRKAEKLEEVAKERKEKSKTKESAFKAGVKSKSADSEPQSAQKAPVAGASKQADIKPKNSDASRQGVEVEGQMQEVQQLK